MKIFVKHIQMEGHLWVQVLMVDQWDKVIVVEYHKQLLFFLYGPIRCSFCENFVHFMKNTQ